MAPLIIVQSVTYFAFAVFFLGLIYRIIKYARVPLHVRWEIYPIPGEIGAEHGGSRFEQVDWWSKPHRKSFFSEIRAMLTEILLVHSLWRHNRRLWYVSYPFHGGIYVTVGFLGLLLIGAVAQAFGAAISVSVGGVGAVVAYLTVVVGVVGFLGVLIGSLGLLIRRIANEDLRLASMPSDYFNLLFILAIASSALLAWATGDNSFSLLRSYLQGVVTLSVIEPTIPLVMLIEILFLSAFLMYLPFTHMMHFVAKYFTYHMVRWDDRPNIRGSALEARIQANLQKPIGWSAKHVGPGSNWAEAAQPVSGGSSQVESGMSAAKEVV